jgi:hypothetical protein
MWFACCGGSLERKDDMAADRQSFEKWLTLVEDTTRELMFGGADRQDVATLYFMEAFRNMVEFVGKDEAFKWLFHTAGMMPELQKAGMLPDNYDDKPSGNGKVVH